MWIKLAPYEQGMARRFFIFVTPEYSNGLLKMGFIHPYIYVTL